MADLRTIHATVLIDAELLAELGEWSLPVQVKINATPGFGTGYELIAREASCTCPHISEVDDYCPQHGRGA